MECADVDCVGPLGVAVEAYGIVPDKEAEDAHELVAACQMRLDPSGGGDAALTAFHIISMLMLDMRKTSHP